MKIFKRKTKKVKKRIFKNNLYKKRHRTNKKTKGG